MSKIDFSSSYGYFKWNPFIFIAGYKGLTMTPTSNKGFVTDAINTMESPIKMLMANIEEATKALSPNRWTTLFESRELFYTTLTDEPGWRAATIMLADVQMSRKVVEAVRVLSYVYQEILAQKDQLAQLTVNNIDSLAPNIVNNELKVLLEWLIDFLIPSKDPNPWIGQCAAVTRCISNDTSNAQAEYLALQASVAILYHEYGHIEKNHTESHTHPNIHIFQSEADSVMVEWILEGMTEQTPEERERRILAIMLFFESGIAGDISVAKYGVPPSVPPGYERMHDALTQAGVNDPNQMEWKITSCILCHYLQRSGLDATITGCSTFQEYVERKSKLLTNIGNTSVGVSNNPARPAD